MRIDVSYQDGPGVGRRGIGGAKLLGSLGELDGAEEEEVVPIDEVLLHVRRRLVAPPQPVHARLVVEEHGALALRARRARLVQVLCKDNKCSHVTSQHMTATVFMLHVVKLGASHKTRQQFSTVATFQVFVSALFEVLCDPARPLVVLTLIKFVVPVCEILFR